MSHPVSIGIDLGTSGVRANAIDGEGELLAQSRVALPSSTQTRPGHQEQQPFDWWKAVLHTIDALPTDVRQAIQAIAVDGTSGTLLLSDEQGEPVSPALMYNDQRAQTEAGSLADIAPPQAAVHSPNSALAKLMWLENNGFSGRHALHQADWIAAQLGAPPGVSDENNCLKLGYDPVTRRWPDWIPATGLDPARLPKVVAVGHTIGQLSSELRKRWGCRNPVSLIAGTTDSNAATLATGINRIGDAATALGSTLVLKILSEQPVFAPEYGIYSHRMGERWLVGGASNSGGLVLRKYFTDEQLKRLSGQVDPRRDSGLDYYPLPSPGERFPLNDPQLRPRLEPRPENEVHFLHGLLEGIARIEQQGYLRLHELGAPFPGRILTTGGGATNETWRRLRERIIGVPIRKAVHSEAAYGAALIAAGRIAW